MYLHDHLVVRAAASAPVTRKRRPNCYGSVLIFARQADCGGTWRTSSLLLRRVRFRSCYRGPALVKTRSRGVRINREALRSRAGGDDNAVCQRPVRPYAGGSCGNSEQRDSDESGNRSMLRHQDLLLLLWSKAPWCGSRELRQGSTAMREVWIAPSRRRTAKLSQIQIAAQTAFV